MSSQRSESSLFFSRHFIALAGISEHSVSQFFPSWNAAIRAAGLPPYTLNLRLDDRELLEDWGCAVRRNRAIPARRTYRHLGKFDHRTFERRFGPWSQLPEVFRNFAQDKPEWADVLALLPPPAPNPSPKRQPVAQAILPVRVLSPRSALRFQKMLDLRAQSKRKQSIGFNAEKLEARDGIEPTIKVLQTFALPLGDRA